MSDVGGAENITNGSHEFRIALPDLSSGECNELLADLESECALVGITTRRNRDDASTMDFGTSLVLVLGAPAVVVAARALLAWAKRNNVASVELHDSKGSFVARGLESQHVASVVKALSDRIGMK